MIHNTKIYNQEKLIEITKEFKDELMFNKDFLEKKLEQLNESIKSGDKKSEMKVTSWINYYKDVIISLERTINSIRMPILTDIEERENMDNFIRDISEVIPDDVPLAFHGNGRIDSVEDIIRTGGLFTQEDRGFNVSWSSSIICICPKNNIRVASDIANVGGNYYVPYGALFVIMPGNKAEALNIQAANKDSNIGCQTQSFKFHDDPDRLMAIVTTSENLDRLKKVAREKGLDENIVVTHNEFIEICKMKYEDNKKISI